MILDIPYRGTEDPKQRLDLFLPSGAAPFPVVVFVHGGGWSDGDKSLYSEVGRWLQQRGIGTAVVNYRLTPQVIHPGHTEDVAAAVAWTHKNIAGYGGDPRRLYVVGYSSGGHLASLVCTNEKYLKWHDMPLSAVRGCVSISGIYHINWSLDLVGYGHIFPKQHRKDASPLLNVRPGLPRFVVVYAKEDILTLDKQAVNFYSKLRQNKCKAELMAVDSDHPSMMQKLLGDSQADRIIDFLLEDCD